MSISRVQQLLQNKGCVWTVSILMVAGVVGSSFTQCGRQNQMERMSQAAPGAIVAQVGDAEITERSIENQVQRMQQMYGSLDALPPEFQLQLRAGTVNSLIEYGFLLQLAKKYGIEPSDDEILKQGEKEAADQMERYRTQLTSMGKIKAGATEQEFADAFKKETGKTPTEVKEMILNQVRDDLKSPDLRLPMAAQTLNGPLLEAVKAKTQVSDEEVKKSFDSFEFKKITISKGDVDSIVKKVQGELKNGLSFEAAIDRYSNDVPEAKKKLSETTSKMARSTIEGVPFFRPLAALKVGQVSEPIRSGNTATIYKVISIKNDAPKDYDKKKKELRDSVLASRAASKLQTELKDMKKNGEIAWRNKAYEALYDFAEMSSEQLDGAKRKERLKSLLEESQKAVEEGAGTGAKAANLLSFVAFNELYKASTPAEQTKMSDQKIEILRGYLQDNENPTLRMELVKLYFDKKNGEGLFEELMAAANANLSQNNPTGQAIYNEINKYVKQGQDGKLLKPEDVKQIEEMQRSWVEQKKENDKYEAEARKLAEEEKKKAEAEKKKNADGVKTRSEFDKSKGTGASGQPKGK